MTDAEIEKTTVEISISNLKSEVSNLKFVAQGEVVKFDGFLKVYLPGLTMRSVCRR